MMFTPIELPKRPCPSPACQHLAAVVGGKKKTQVVSIYLYACELHALSQMQLREVCAHDEFSTHDGNCFSKCQNPSGNSSRPLGDYEGISRWFIIP